MKKLTWFLAGASLGYVFAKQLAENPKAQALVADARDRAKSFGAAVSEGYREREAELAAADSKQPAAKTSATKSNSK
jgi:hypothetical protein